MVHIVNKKNKTSFTMEDYRLIRFKQPLKTDIEEKEDDNRDGGFHQIIKIKRSIICKR